MQNRSSRAINGRSLLFSALGTLLTSCSTVETAPQPSCADAPRCGLAPGEDCCASPDVPGGTFNRVNNPAWPATVSPYRLDAFEVTVGRFRRFADAYPGSAPKPGAGAHPRIPGSGWKAEWSDDLPATRELLLEDLNCPNLDPDKGPVEFHTWTDEPGERESMPMVCLSWFEAFAFCAWDEGRLPTQAEWNFAAAGGSEQRAFPWGAAPPDPTLAVLDFSPDHTMPTPFIPVGSKPAGKGRWGHYDFGGSRTEYLLDEREYPVKESYVDELPVPCTDCAELRPDWERVRLMADNTFYIGPTEGPVLSVLFWTTIDRTSTESWGVRCARDR